MFKIKSKNKSLKFILCFLFCLVLFFICFSISAQAKTITIQTPEELHEINWANKGFGPGNTYIIGADMTLGDSGEATVLLTSGKFVIDFNGHTVQNANNSLGVFSLRGADVIFKDSKVSSSKASIRSYGAGAIDMTAGTLTINSGNYIGLSNGTNNPSGLHVGGGTCVVNNGFFYGDTIGADCSGGNLYINNGTFQTAYMFALSNLGSGNIKIYKADFISGTTTYGYHFSLGAYSNQQYYDFSSWLADGSSFSTSFQTGYWNMQSSVTAYPAYGNYFAVSYETPRLSVTASGVSPLPTGSTESASFSKAKVKSIKAGKNQLKVSWNKVSGASGYQLQVATDKRFTKNKKTVNVSASAASKTIKKLKKNKKYYVRIRAYSKSGSKKVYSSWSAVKTKKTK